MSTQVQEVRAGDRFEFGKNWESYLRLLSPERIRIAEESLRDMLEVPDLEDKSFIDIGSGSGLFSLAATNLGARVLSFDYDPVSVKCTESLRQRYHSDSPRWHVEGGSVLDKGFLASLGTFDVVYSWGVLHHTGAMWEALANVEPLVGPQGRLFISIYNDQGPWSRRWRAMKRLYNRLPQPLKMPYAVLVMGPRELRMLVAQLAHGRFLGYLREYQSGRGMDRLHDLIDWIGGYPFEVAKPEQIFDFFRQRGLQLDRLATCAGSIGCNQYVFHRAPGVASALH